MKQKPPPLTHALEKALTDLCYGQSMSEDARKLARVASGELLLVIRKLDLRVEALEKVEKQ